MSRYLVVGNPVIALDRDGIIPDGAVIVEDKNIVEVGPRAALETKGNFQRVIGSPDHFVLPGFINCHYHSEGAIGPGLYQYVFEQANMYFQAAMGAITDEDLYLGVLQGLINCIRGGQTATIDMYYGRPMLEDFGTNAVLRAYDDAGMRTAFGLVSRDQNKYVHEPNEKFLARLPQDLAQEVAASNMGYAWPLDRVFGAYDQLVRDWDGKDDRIRVICAPDWTPACSDDLYRRCRRVANEYGTGIATHCLETRAEMMFNHQSYGKPALKRLADIGLLGPDVSLPHFVWVTDEEIPIFADSGAVASYDPGSNLRLSSGIARFRDITDAGGLMGIGTDCIGFSDKEDMFQELRLGMYLQRRPHEFEVGRLDSERTLRTIGKAGARGVRFEDKVGRLAPGTYADLLVVKRDRIFFPPGRYDRTPVLDVILDRAEAIDIDSVLINGRVVLDEGRITTVDEEKVRAAWAKATERVYEVTPELARGAELGDAMLPYINEFYRRWYETPLQPAHTYNVASPPDLSATDADRP
ncbi:MAG: amidohydrolase family protein [Dehalococcoidia bacterium]